MHRDAQATPRDAWTLVCSTCRETRRVKFKTMLPRTVVRARTYEFCRNCRPKYNVGTTPHNGRCRPCQKAWRRAARAERNSAWNKIVRRDYKKRGIKMEFPR